MVGIALDVFDCFAHLIEHGRRLLVVTTLGLDGEVHLFDDATQDGGIDLVLLEDLRDFADVDFRHGCARILVLR
jgi:hypothetical protein